MKVRLETCARVAEIAGAIAVVMSIIYLAVRWVEAVYPGVAYYNQVDRGGHFGAWKVPALFATELRAAFKPLR